MLPVEIENQAGYHRQAGSPHYWRRGLGPGPGVRRVDIADSNWVRTSTIRPSQPA